MSGIVAGKLAFVTGAGSGIGRAVCQVLAREGATVVAADVNYGAAVETLEKNLPSFTTEQRNHSAVELDVVDSSSVQKALRATVERYSKPPTVVVNSAGITRDNWQLHMTEKEFDDVINVNIKGVFLVSQAFSKAMVDAKVQSGSIINLSSIVARRGHRGHINYVTTKSGLLGMSRSSARELGRYNIRSGRNNSVPGFGPQFLCNGSGI